MYQACTVYTVLDLPTDPGGGFYPKQKLPLQPRPGTGQTCSKDLTQTTACSASAVGQPPGKQRVNAYCYKHRYFRLSVAAVKPHYECLEVGITVAKE